MTCKYSSAVPPTVCGTAHQKRECACVEGKGVGHCTPFPVVCPLILCTLGLRPIFSTQIKLDQFQAVMHSIQVVKLLKCEKLHVKNNGQLKGIMGERGLVSAWLFLISVCFLFWSVGSCTPQHTVLYTRHLSQTQTECRRTFLVCVCKEFKRRTLTWSVQVLQ